MVLTTVCRVGARKGRTSFDGCHADATPSALWLKVYPPACHPCIVLTSLPLLSLCIFFSLGAVFRVCPAQPLLDQAGGGWPPASFAWHRPTQTGLAPGKKLRLSSTRSRAVQVWPLGEETGCVVLTTVCRVGARMGRTSIDVLMPMLCRRHCGSKCTRPRATLVKY